MDTSIYLISQIIILLLAFGLLRSLIFGLKHALIKMPIKAKKRTQLQNYVLGGLILWLGIVSVGAWSGFFRNLEMLPPRILIVLLPPLIIIVWLMFSRLFGLILKALPESWLIKVQSFRIFMEFLLWLGFLGGFVPIQMTFEWLNFDIMVGITALMAGSVFFGQGRYRRPEAIIWNIFGIVLLINIVIIAVLSMPAPFQVFMNEPTTIFMTGFPFIWILGFFVPFALAMHLFSLRQLFLSKRATGFFVK